MHKRVLDVRDIYGSNVSYSPVVHMHSTNLCLSMYKPPVVIIHWKIKIDIDIDIDTDIDIDR